jgi:hypothetical protein
MSFLSWTPSGPPRLQNEINANVLCDLESRVEHAIEAPGWPGRFRRDKRSAGARTTMLFRMITGQDKPDSGSNRSARTLSSATLTNRAPRSTPKTTVWEGNLRLGYCHAPSESESARLARLVADGDERKNY